MATIDEVLKLVRKLKREKKSKGQIYQSRKRLERAYGITLEQKVEILQRQENKCAICKVPLTDIYSPHVDHCHETKIVRGVLCPSCNVGLGHFRDNIETLKSAIKYLKMHKRGAQT